jgi:hypothetical protein
MEKLNQPFLVDSPILEWLQDDLDVSSEKLQQELDAILNDLSFLKGLHFFGDSLSSEQLQQELSCILSGNSIQNIVSPIPTTPMCQPSFVTVRMDEKAGCEKLPVKRRRIRNGCHVKNCYRRFSRVDGLTRHKHIYMKPRKKSHYKYQRQICVNFLLNFQNAERDPDQQQIDIFGKIYNLLSETDKIYVKSVIKAPKNGLYKMLKI